MKSLATDQAESMGDTNVRFAHTRWSIVLAAKATGSPEAEAALARLCEIYWYPIYAFLRRKGHSKHEAEDLTQGFFAQILRREWLKNVGPEKGRFRTFILICLKHFVLNQPREPSMISVDFSNAEERYGVEPVDSVTPEQLFELRWAAGLLERGTATLKAEATAEGKLERFEVLFPYLSRETAPGNFAEAAERLGIADAAARQEASRLRKRYREIIRAEIRETVVFAQDVDDELQHLLGIFSQ